MFDKDNLKKCESFGEILHYVTYVEVIEGREKLPSLKKKYERENKKWFSKWGEVETDEYIALGIEPFSKKYREIGFKIDCYVNFLKELDNLYLSGFMVVKGDSYIELIKYMLANRVKLKIYRRYNTMGNRNVLINKVSKQELLKAYLKFKNIFLQKKCILVIPKTFSTKEIRKNVYDEIIKCFHDLINYGYCLLKDSIRLIFKKFNLEYDIEQTEGIWQKIKNRLTKAKQKLMQFIKRSIKIANFSGGKDSAYMIIKCIERGIKFDHIVFADTLLELPEMYDYIDKFEQYIGQKIIRLKPKIIFDDWFYKPFAYGKNEGKIHGFPYVIGDGCWTRRELKIKSMESFKKSIDGPVIDYIGIAANEPERYKKLILDKQQAPLVDWGITEEDCIRELKTLNLLNPLYEKFKRLGCWLCPKQGIESLKVIYYDYPKLWQKLREYQKDDYKPFKPNMTIDDIEKRILKV